MSQTQSLFNIAVSIIILLAGWWNKSILDSIKEVKDGLSEHLQNHNELKLLVVSEYVPKKDFEKTLDTIVKKLDKLENLELLLANNHVTHNSFKEGMNTLAAKLDRIERKLDNKADK